MAYVDPDFKTKKALKEAVAAGKKLYPYSPGPFPVEQNGRVSIEGPHYPKPHAWYADCDVVGGVITKVK
jgi:hypothetical protein